MNWRSRAETISFGSPDIMWLIMWPERPFLKMASLLIEVWRRAWAQSVTFRVFHVINKGNTGLWCFRRICSVYILGKERQDLPHLLVLDLKVREERRSIETTVRLSADLLPSSLFGPGSFLKNDNESFYSSLIGYFQKCLPDIVPFFSLPKSISLFLELRFVCFILCFWYNVVRLPDQ